MFSERKANSSSSGDLMSVLGFEPLGLESFEPSDPIAETKHKHELESKNLTHSFLCLIQKELTTNE